MTFIVAVILVTLCGRSAVAVVRRIVLCQKRIGGKKAEKRNRVQMLTASFAIYRYLY